MFASPEPLHVLRMDHATKV